MEIIVGMKGEAFSFVEREDTAKEVGSGSLLVYATPCMVALMEGAACDAIKDALGEEKTSVGTELNISHLSATPVGLEVRAEAEVTAVDGSTITFQVTAYDEETGKGLVRHVLIRKGFTSGELMVCLVINYKGKKEFLPHQEKLLARLQQIPGMTSISVSIHTEKTNVAQLYTT